MNKPIKLYEPASTDGYTSSGDGRYFVEEGLARASATMKHGAYASTPHVHDAIPTGDGGYWLLKSTKPVVVADSLQEHERIKQHALAKLSKEERAALGYPDLG